MSSTLKTEAVLATCADERYPPSNMTDGRHDTYYLTTGSFPQEVLFAFKTGTVNVSKIVFVSHSVKKIRIERCGESTPTRFDPIVDCEIKALEGGGRVTEPFVINKATGGSNVQFLKLVIESGYDDFVGVFEFSVEGDEVD